MPFVTLPDTRLPLVNGGRLVGLPFFRNGLPRCRIGVLITLLLFSACKEKTATATDSTLPTHGTAQGAAVPLSSATADPSAAQVGDEAMAVATIPQKPSEPPPHVATFLRSIPNHLAPKYDPHSPAGLDWIRVSGPLIGDDRWLVIQFSSNTEAEARASGTQRTSPRNELAAQVLGERTESSRQPRLIPVSGTEPRRFRLSKGNLTLEGDAKPQLFAELVQALSPDRFWPQAGVEIDGQGTALSVLDLGQDKLKTVVLLQKYIWPRMLLRDLERIVFPLPSLVGHVPNPEHAQRIKAELEAAGAKVKLTPPTSR